MFILNFVLFVAFTSHQWCTTRQRVSFWCTECLRSTVYTRRIESLMTTTAAATTALQQLHAVDFTDGNYVTGSGCIETVERIELVLERILLCYFVIKHFELRPQITTLSCTALLWTLPFFGCYKLSATVASRSLDRDCHRQGKQVCDDSSQFCYQPYTELRTLSAIAWWDYTQRPRPTVTERVRGFMYKKTSSHII